MENEIVLKPCPFCGGDAGLGYSPDGHFVNCTVCCASTNNLTAHGNTKEEAIELWNTRKNNEYSLISKDDVVRIVDNCFHAYASSYRFEAKEMAEAQVKRVLKNGT
jgi:Lar family restriction alleviation protein